MIDEIPIETGHCFAVPDLDKWIFILWDKTTHSHPGNPPGNYKHREPYYINIDEDTTDAQLQAKLDDAIEECKGKRE